MNVLRYAMNYPPQINWSAYDYIILGEMHGSAENAHVVTYVLDTILESVSDVAIGFEWVLTNAELEQLNGYIVGGPVPETLPEFFTDSDGRFTLEHCALLRHIRQMNSTQRVRIKVFTFDGGEVTGDYEEHLAARILDYKDATSDLILIETGVVHASKGSYLENRITKSCMASILSAKSRVFSFFLEYKSGAITVEGDSVDVTLFESQIEGPGIHFDGVIEIEHSHPATAVINLTDVAEMLK